ncbi:acylphosphatase [Tissierella creatinini]|nr:acylphosphatase [Tissierella creatinini]
MNQVKNLRLPDFKPSNILRKRIIFSGEVQNVGFRLEIHELAKRLNLTGWVKNREDKSVEAEIQGEADKINYLIDFMKSLKRAKVEGAEIKDMEVLEGEHSFIQVCRGGRYW